MEVIEVISHFKVCTYVVAPAGSARLCMWKRQLVRDSAHNRM